MAIAPDASGSAAVITGVTSATLDITAAATGAWCYAWVAVGSSNAGAASIAATGWTVVQGAADGTTAEYAVLRRLKIAGDTTFTVTWSTAAHGELVWASWTGVDATTPDEASAIATNGVTSRSAVPTPAATPTAADRWAAGFFSVRTSTVGNKAIDWTPDAATTERVDANNSAGTSSVWFGNEIADTAAAVTQASHSYTATHNVTGTPTSESHDGSAILFLIPAAAAAAAGARAAQPGRTWLRRFHHRQFPPPAATVTAAPQAGPPVYPPGHPVQARGGPQPGGRVTSRAGTYAGTGPAVRPHGGPVKAQPATPVLTGRTAGRAGTYAGLGPAVKALAAPIAARLRVLPPRGRTASRAGTYAGTGPPVTPPHGPARAQPAPARGGRAASRAGTYTQVTLGAGPPVYPLGHPVQARRLPARGGSTASHRGAYGGLGPPVKAPEGPVRAQPGPPRGGRTASRAGTYTLVVTGSGPPVYPLGHPVQARRQPALGGHVIRRAGTWQGTGPAVRPLSGPAGVSRRQPPPPARGRTASQRGPWSGTGPPPIRLRRPVQGQPGRPFLTGRADGRAGVYTAPFVPPFTVGALTAADKPGSVLTAAGTSSTLTASTAAQGALTAATSAAGAAEYGSTYGSTYGPQEGTLTATDTRTGGPG